VTGCLYRSLAGQVQALFAANRAYLVNEKGALARAETLPECPPDFRARAEGALAAIGREPAELDRALAAMRELEREVQALARTLPNRRESPCQQRERG